MNWGGPTFVIAIIAICYGGWILNNWIRARHGYPLEDEWGGKTDQKLPDAERKIGLLTNENEALQATSAVWKNGSQFWNASSPTSRTDCRKK